MFEAPLNIHSKVLANERKIRYQYINTFTKRYSQLYGDTIPSSSLESNRSRTPITLPTPEASAHEHSDSNTNYNDDSDSISNTNTLSDDEYNSDSTGTTNEETKFFNRYDRPQESFEVWNTSIDTLNSKTKLKSNGRIPINRNKISFNRLNRVKKFTNKKLEARLQHCTKRLKTHIKAISEGYETSYRDKQTTSFNNIHIENLINLLYYNICEKNFNQAYHIFSLIIRLPNIDIRNFWNLGSIILLKKVSIQESLNFLNWIHSIYSSNQKYNNSINYKTAPAFTQSSRNHTGKFTTSFLWMTLSLIHTKFSDLTSRNIKEIVEELNYLKKKLKKFVEKLSEMVLAPPFIEDSEIWYIYSLSHLILARMLMFETRNNDISQTSVEKDITKNEIISNIQHCKSHLQKVRENQNDYNFKFQKIEIELKDMEKKLYDTSSDEEILNEEEFLDNEDVLDNEENNFNHEINFEHKNNQLMTPSYDEPIYKYNLDDEFSGQTHLDSENEMTQSHFESNKYNSSSD
ncbi:hypothetical protein TBLA_0B00570 [Henningerozyma blattae CBS 6284]|uniref:RNA polymerase I-specific transcription initiation factor RRN11 n=1 Tax=Henningerozyma blattae (strain ATCC 34711 / CBS 6284 / DSM 70876 / NBRC 10599 / NRRL Y-10934 / UCD 77-7) TaxID=1071380 RepID=I2GXP9_HENB6|nr:hypothetical protein TBLA_0B00570 [Tetrapisispora blattae CBS 6284]CCH58901.1 hypothetical protein TBLA_0B00570 [Tetrapisispora blattae CBS 6284]